MSNLKPGETVKIYEDPWTQKKLEGEAKLIERLQEESDREYWLVEFTDSHERHPRWIKKKTSTSPTEDKGDVTYPWKLPFRANLCDRLEHFLMDEEKGISDYLGYIILINEGLKSLKPQDEINRYVVQDLLVTVNRIVEEERSHVEMLKRIKERLCP